MRASVPTTPLPPFASYLPQVLGLDLRSSGFYSVLPWVTMAVSWAAPRGLATAGAVGLRVGAGSGTCCCTFPTRWEGTLP